MPASRAISLKARLVKLRPSPIKLSAACSSVARVMSLRSVRDRLDLALVSVMGGLAL